MTTRSTDQLFQLVRYLAEGVDPIEDVAPALRQAIPATRAVPPALVQRFAQELHLSLDSGIHDDWSGEQWVAHIESESVDFMRGLMTTLDEEPAVETARVIQAIALALLEMIDNPTD